jgi:adenine-specific DNA-methyltransferase
MILAGLGKRVIFPHAITTVLAPTPSRHHPVDTSRSPHKDDTGQLSKEKLEELNADGRIWWGKDGNNVPALKRFLSEVLEGIVPQTIWFYEEVGHNQAAKQHLKALLPDVEELFVTPKPEGLVERILQIASDADDWVLDSFAGTGTNGSEVLPGDTPGPEG